MSERLLPKFWDRFAVCLAPHSCSPLCQGDECWPAVLKDLAKAAIEHSPDEQSQMRAQRLLFILTKK